MTRCVQCLAETPVAEFLANDYLCNECAAKPETFPLATTPDAKEMCAACGVREAKRLIALDGKKIHPGSIVTLACYECAAKEEP